jgi:hypothetical protein
MEMQAGGRKVIMQKKYRLWLVFLGALAFTAAGVWMAVHPVELNQGRFRNATVNAIMGGTGSVFFGICAWFIGRKLRTGEPGLIIDPGGFTDNSSATAAGWVPWSDVENLSIVQVRGQRFVLVQVRNPANYLLRASGLAKKAMEMNDRMYGSPVLLSATGLQLGFDELMRLLKEGYENYHAEGR